MVGELANGWLVAGGVVGLVLMAKKTTAGAGVVDTVKVQRFAEAIAYAEGFRPGTLPWKNNNPGDLKISSVRSIGHDEQGHLVFATPEDGWRALRVQLGYIVTGQSNVYKLDMTIRTMGTKYAEWSANWSKNVAGKLGVSEDTTLRAVLV